MAVDLNTISETLGKNTSMATDNLKEAMTKASSGKPEDLVNMQMSLQKWTMMNQLQSSMIQQLGIGLGTAVLIDATIVRLGLLPAIMKLAGDRTWWLPTWLDEKLPYLDTEGSVFARDADHLRVTPASSALSASTSV